MSTITAVLEPDLDGTLHLPVPAEMRSTKIKVTATLESIAERPSQAEAMAALQALSRLGTFRHIKDPVAWQRETREDSRAGSSI
ncbi:MAG: hypothetical protein ACKOKC_16060 [Chthoniobacterales bacterium]